MSEQQARMSEQQAGMNERPAAATPECLGSQTVGPYYAIGLDHLVSETLAGPDVPGRHITIQGTVFDADGEPVPDAILELWQATPEGSYDFAGKAYNGFARLSTQNAGRFQVHTVAPGPVPYGDGCMQAPHLVVLVFMRGLMRHLVTRIYLPDDSRNADDPVLASIPERRRATLIARSVDHSGDLLQWDLHLQGEAETVFFSC